MTLALVPLISLIGIWAFAATITVQSGLDLLQVQSIYTNVIVPAGNLSTQLHHERYESLAYLGSSSGDRTALEAQRARTDQARAVLEQKALPGGVQDVPDLSIYQRAIELVTVTGRLPDIRARVDAKSFTPLLTLDAYDLISDAVARVYDSLRLAGDPELGPPTRAITLIDRSRDLMWQQAALVVGAAAAGTMSTDEQTAFTAMVTKRRLLYDMGFQLLDDELRQPYLVLQNSQAYTRFSSIEDQISQDVGGGRALPAASAKWAENVQAATRLFDRQNGVAARQIADRATPIAMGILWRIGVAAGLGLIGIGFSLWVCVRFGRRITAELVHLQSVALELANRRLPSVVRRLRQGEDVDVAAETPPIATGTTEEIVSVGQAFTSVQTTAVQAAVGQAEIRKGVGKVFLNLARRNQSLLHRQLSMLDALERKVTDPDLLDELFGIDHLTTRMRRHAEGLIILSGAVPGRGWRTPVPMFDVVRAAVEEVEDYLRVHVAMPEDMALSGNAATDVIHLLAELVENATIFSPPHTHVEVRGEAVARGFAIEVEDRGLGLSPEEMDQINARLADPPEFDLADSDRLGLFVVGRLAARRGIRVSLRVSPYGGTTAIVLLPEGLVTSADSVPREQYSLERIAAVEAGTGHARPSRGNGTSGGLAVAGGSGDGEGRAAVESRSADDAAGNGGRAANGRSKGAAGLPHRVRQANLAPQLRDAATPPESAPGRPGGGEHLQPSPDMFSSFRAGWQRARDGEEDRT
ncbi:nitrate- and nitrite sensing domain-containing protein [Sphaerisporangium album]|uniref:nitrate- and nitrite sensing domain-containing protein n=1 Tax=Sphaerisporangium album TaxID=509200 RepID=UPI0015F02124|nr:nitrate- and nitrite sensing domain-containing protein [Sphaerisporangium album]